MQKKNSDLGFPLSQRPAPSAGAIHPIHVVLNFPDNDRWWRYDADSHVLIEIDGQNVLGPLRVHCAEVLPLNNGLLVLFVAEPGKTLSKYDAGCSLIWRDAGVLLGLMSLTAEALQLNFCPLGITGEPWARQLNQQGHLVGVGVAVLGSSFC
jgi:hypothetical protein